jgi:hypothetical protein
MQTGRSDLSLSGITVVSFEQAIRVDGVTESPKLNDRAATFNSGHLGLAVQVEEPA